MNYNAEICNGYLRNSHFLIQREVSNPIQQSTLFVESKVSTKNHISYLLTFMSPLGGCAKLTGWLKEKFITTCNKYQNLTSTFALNFYYSFLFLFSCE